MKILGILFTATWLLLTSCSKDSSNIESIDKGDYSLLLNSEIFNQAAQSRSDLFSDEFEIESIQRKSDNLQVILVFKGDCATNKFEVIWNGLIMESYPEQTIFLLKRNAENCGSSLTEKRQTLNIDLGEILKDEEMAKRIRVTICNASKKSTVPNADVSVSGSSN
jgi:hypothetical protein